MSVACTCFVSKDSDSKSLLCCISALYCAVVTMSKLLKNPISLYLSNAFPNGNLNNPKKAMGFKFY